MVVSAIRWFSALVQHILVYENRGRKTGVENRGRVLILDLIISNIHLILLLRQIRRSSFYLPALNKHFPTNTHRFPLNRNHRTIPKLSMTGADVDIFHNFGKLLEISGDGCMIHTIFFLDS